MVNRDRPSAVPITADWLSSASICPLYRVAYQVQVTAGKRETSVSPDPKVCVNSRQQRESARDRKVGCKLVPQATTCGETGDRGIASGFPQWWVVAADLFHQLTRHDAVLVTVQFDMASRSSIWLQIEDRFSPGVGNDLPRRCRMVVNNRCEVSLIPSFVF